MSTQQDTRQAGSLQLGVQKYLYTGYFVAGCIIAWLVNNIIEKIWGESRTRVNLRFTTVDLGTIAIVVGVLAGLAAVVFAWKNERIRTLAQETVDELARVTWPSRQETYGATVVVIVTSMISAAVIFVLDRFWSWLTDLIYR